MKVTGQSSANANSRYSSSGWTRLQNLHVFQYAVPIYARVTAHETC